MMNLNKEVNFKDLERNNMNNGKEMLKKTTDAMHVENLIKGKPCPKCGDKMDKMGCMKMGCGGMKKGKKPAHGMVIVIGSKAGPGPSKDGKREKLDSEKKD
jgi:hypothetical protein